MCGIWGVVSRDEEVEREAVERMNATLVHRGPDSDGVVVDGAGALATNAGSMNGAAHAPSLDATTRITTSSLRDRAPSSCCLYWPSSLMNSSRTPERSRRSSSPNLRGST
jgi:hypothetical protein